MFEIKGYLNSVFYASDTGVPATALATNDSTIGTVGEDGAISVAEISAEQFRVVLRLGNVRVSSLTLMKFTT
jgi:hypothetical protein